MLQNRNTAHATAALQAKSSAYTETLRPIVERLYASGINTQSQLAKALNAEGVPASRGGRWHQGSARNLLVRLGLLSPSAVVPRGRSSNRISKLPRP